MEENKFEKQVRQKMDELKIHPSDSVWEKIEARLEKKKRPNRGILVFLLVFCVFLAGGYLLWNTMQHPITKGNNAEKNYSEKSTSGIPVIKNNNNSGATNNLVPGSITKKINTVGNAPIKNNINKNSLQHYQLSTAKKVIKINPGEKATMVFSKQQEVKDVISENTDSKPGIVQPLEIQPENKKIKSGIKDSAYNELNKDDLSKPPSLQDEKANVKDTLKQTRTSPETVKHSKKNKWKPGLLFSGGISGVGNNFLGLVNSPAYDYSNPANNSGNGQGTTPLTTPSRTRSAFGFMAGVFAERNISAKARLVVGINYKSFNTSNKVGTRNDTTGLYNSLNSVNTHKNHYNFIELPLTVKIQIGRGKNIPLFWQGGLVVSELVSSNSLQFNPISGLYYHNNSIFNKTQIGLNTSVSAALFSEQKNSVLIGPYFYYGATRLAHEGLYNKKHFVFTGLQAEIIFGK